MASVGKFAVLGSGNGARAWCAQIAARGYSVSMWEPLEATEDYAKLREERRMYLEGDISVGGSLERVTMDIAEAMEGAEFILVVVPSFAHEPIFAKMIPCLEDGQNVVLVPGNFGGLLLRRMMADAGVKRNISVSETATMPYACRISRYDTVMVYKRKYAMKMATSPAAKNGEILEILNDVFDGYVKFNPAVNLLETDLDNPNYSLHPFPVLLNYGEVEKRPDTYKHYINGITPLVSEQIHRMDDERLAIGRKLDLNLQGTLSKLKMYYGQNDSETVFEYVHSPETPYADLVGQNVRSRYITEDVPGVVATTVLLARKAGIEAPIAELVVRLASQLHGVDYLDSGATLERLGVADLSIEEIVALVS